MEIDQPEGEGLHDTAGHARRRIRSRWWQRAPATGLDVARGPNATLKAIPDLPLADGVLPGYANDKPVFVGHYWFQGTPQPLTDHVACLAYSVAARHRGRPAAHRWDGAGAPRQARCVSLQAARRSESA